MTTATRTLPPHGTEARYCPGKNGRPACHCGPCTRAGRLANIRRDHIRAVHGSNTIDREVLLRHVNRLREAGMSQGGIARAADVSATTISYIVLGKLKGCQRDKALRILAVQPGFDDRAIRPVAGTIRRVRALYAIGHGQASVAKATGLSESGISHIANGWVGSVSASTAAKVAAAYRVLITKPGTSRKARTHANAKGWHGPLAWGDDIDDPNAQPEIDTAQPALRYVAIAEDALWLERQGYTREQIAHRLGVTRDRVQQSLRRFQREQVATTTTAEVTPLHVKPEGTSEGTSELGVAA